MNKRRPPHIGLARPLGLVFLCLLLMLATLCRTAFAAPTVHPPLVLTIYLSFPAKDAADAWGFAMPLAHKDKITERGFCWSTTPSPSKNCKKAGSVLGFFVLPLSGLKAGHTFYVRAYAVSTAGVTYGNQLSFTLPPPFIPTALTDDPEPIGPNSAILGGDATHEGHAPVLERGVCWGTKPLPGFHDECAAMGSGLGRFSQEIDSFEPGVTYYARAYAASDLGTGWGADKAFSTSQDDTPKVTTAAPYNETDISALSGGNVTHGGLTPVTARGVCWSIAPRPTTRDARTNDGKGTGSFHSLMSGLEPLTEYYVRAYATNSGGTGYGEEYMFKTAHPIYPKVGTVGTIQVFGASALLEGEIVLTGDATADERGFCWSTSPQPLIDGSHAAAKGSGAGMFQVMLEGLKPETLYYARAYAKNQYGVFYGNIIHFKTDLCSYPCR
jgi:hypothetical protein